MKFTANLLFIFVFTVLIICNTKAQRLRDAVHLKTGSIIRGKISTINDTTKVAIESGENLWIFAKEEIDYVQEEIVPSNEPFIRHKKHETDFILSLHGLGEEMRIGFSATQSMYLHSDKLIGGIGTGFEFYEWMSVPLFIDLRYYMISRKKTPFIAVRGGYGFSFEDDREEWNNIFEKRGGPMYELCFGVRNNFKRNAAFIMSVGYKHQLLREIQRFSTTLREIYITEYHYNHISFNFGLVF